MLLSHLPSTSDCIIHTRSWASFATHHTHATTTTTDVYEGTFLNGRKHGRGRLQFANGDVYEGDFKNGLIDGTGEYQFVSGDVYVGDYLNGVQHGMGIVVYADGQRYEGTFANGVPHGQGTLFYFESEGVPARMLPTNAATQPCVPHVLNMRETACVLVFGLCHADGTSEYYVGEFREGLEHGIGTYHYANGDVYEGQYVSGKRHGHGRYTYARPASSAGDTAEWFYDGDYQHDQRSGSGAYRCIDCNRDQSRSVSCWIAQSILLDRWM